MSTLTSADILTNGVCIHYHRIERTPQTRPWPSLVLLHGITDSGLCWPRVVKALGAEYDMILPDARGHGLSEKPETGYAAQDHAADVAGLIRGLGLDRLQTLQGDFITVTKQGNQVKINDATIIASDILASNGIIHIIDRVLMPRSSNK